MLIISEDEKRKQLKNDKNRKAPGPGGINLELLKYKGENIIILIIRPIIFIVREENIPE